jgi:hypothetical protein
MLLLQQQHARRQIKAVMIVKTVWMNDCVKQH